MSQQSLFQDTIFALSSGALPSGVAVVRLSGKHVRDALSVLAGGSPPPRKAVLRSITNKVGEQLDHGLVLFFEAPRSFTGDDCAELHLHGGKAVVQAVLTCLSEVPNLRQADAGEFTRRAFLNGKIDLTAAEAIGDLVIAETEMQRKLALDNSGGRQHDLYAAWRSRLLHARAMIEAELDFADEGDVPGSVSEAVWADMALLEQEIATHIEGFRAAEIIRTGFRVVLVGAPNAGKSSLLNALARRDVAIVTDVPGTTRDLVEVALGLEGAKVVVTDTAGIRDTIDIVEQIGVERAVGAARGADLVIEIIDPLARQEMASGSWDVPVLRVLSKSDLISEDMITPRFDHVVSAHSGAGLAGLIADIAVRVQSAISRDGLAVPSRIRHVQALRESVEHIHHGRHGAHSGLELQAEELRLASAALGRIIGSVDVEDLLDVIFSSFCIGK